MVNVFCLILLAVLIIVLSAINKAQVIQNNNADNAMTAMIFCLMDNVFNLSQSAMIITANYVTDRVHQTLFKYVNNAMINIYYTQQEFAFKNKKNAKINNAHSAI